MTTDEVIQYFGNATNVANACTRDGWELGKSAVCQWGEHPPPGRQFQIELITKGVLKASRKVVCAELLA